MPSDPGIAWLGVAWVGTVILAWVGWVPLSLLDQVVLLGIAVVLPLSICIGGRLWWWAAAAGGALLSFLVPTGWAGLLVTPFFVAAVWTAWMHASAAGPLRAWRIVETAEVTASAYAAGAAGALAQSRFGVGLFDIYEPIVQLTAVHFTFAGSAALVLAVAWASAHYWNVPALSIPDMARTHGLANAFGFVLCGLLARRLERTRVRAQDVMA